MRNEPRRNYDRSRSAWRTSRTLVAFGVGLTLLCAPRRSSAQASQLIKPLASVTGADYFGIHIHRAIATGRDSASAWPDIGAAAWRLWDTRVTWQNLEPERGKWDFNRLDSLVALAQRHKVDLLLTLGVTPTWASTRPEEASNYGPGGKAPPRDLNDWRDYVRTVALRYKGRIRSYEIWNEPNLVEYFSGRPQDLVELAHAAYDVLKGVDSSNIVVSPSATGQLRGAQWLDGYLTLGGDRYLDVVGFHFYVTPAAPERMIPVANAVHDVMRSHGLQNVPLWNTESGWFMQNRLSEVKPEGLPGTFKSRVLDENESIAWTARALLIGRCAGIDRYYWYAWDNRAMGFTDADGRTMKPVAQSYATVRNWILGGTVTRCQRSQQGVWSVSVDQPGKSPSTIVWADSLPTSIATAPNVVGTSTLPDGRTKRLRKPGARLSVGASPVRLVTSR